MEEEEPVTGDVVTGKKVSIFHQLRALETPHPVDLEEEEEEKEGRKLRDKVKGRGKNGSRRWFD